MTSRLQQLHDAGQAIWLDFVDREFLASGGLRRLVEQDALTGVTSNPSIFEKAMGSGAAYDHGFASFLQLSDASVVATYEAQAIDDIRSAADDLRSVYDQTDGQDGYVSLEVSPYLADNTEGTIAEARRLWTTVDRPNLMVKVPGTTAGVPAVRQLIEDGLNINVTLLFSRKAYEAVADAYVAGLEARVAAQRPVSGIASVASFFVSRIDAVIDATIDGRIAAGDAESEALKAVRGNVATANAKLAYVDYVARVQSARWRALADKGAMPQRLLWASTGTKDPSYSDTRYVDGLIGPDTVNTMPPKTMDAFRDHGQIRPTLTDDVPAARHIFSETERLGLDLTGVTERLAVEGVRKFAAAFDHLLATVAGKRTRFLGDRINGLSSILPPELQSSVEQAMAKAQTGGWSRRLWEGDASLWTGKDEAKWTGWLGAAKGLQVDQTALAALGKEARCYRHAVLLGMGGSSLGPEVMSLILGSRPGSPTLHVLDTTDPGQIRSVAALIEPQSTLFIISSKSGSTMEPELLRSFFFDHAGKDGGRFIAVTDPGSKLQATAAADGFSHVFLGDKTIGGRYSVLSAFGMVPAAVMGIDIAAFYEASLPMVYACGPDVPPTENPGVRLGVIIGEAAKAGRNKLTIVPSAGLVPFGAWLEQLLAESTGKIGRGVIPVDLEHLRGPETYGSDRLFVHLHLAGDEDDTMEAQLAALADAGHPVISVAVGGRELIGQEFFRWEVATAIAGAVIGIDPFDQPDVEDAKVATRKLVDAYEQSGSLDPESSLFEDRDLAIYGTQGVEGAGDAVAILAKHLGSLTSGDYLGFLAYIQRDSYHAAAISRMRTAVHTSKKVATVAGFGPRFLHSTGQVYKGGPPTGVFVEITREPAWDLAIPGHRASFGTVQLAQARGDLDVLAERGQRVLRVHLKKGDISVLEDLVTTALLA
jgi:transaldolase/glucose-6-phosphate isomerase